MTPRVLVGIVAGILAWASVTFAQPQPLSEALSDPQFVRNLSWKADKDLEAVVRNWPAYTGAQGFEDKTVLKTADVTILDTVFTAEYRVFKANSFAEVVLLHKSNYGEDFCPAFLGWTGKRLGKPDKVLDRSVLGRDSSFNDVAADWLLGQTRVQLTCAGAKLYGGYVPAIAVLIYRHQDQLKALEDLIYIECSSTKKYVGPLLADRPTEDGPPLTLIIDPNGGKLLGRDKSLFLKPDKYTDEEILASEEDDKRKQDFRLDRVTGNYQWNIRLKSDTRNGLNQWGRCSRVDPARKF